MTNRDTFRTKIREFDPLGIGAWAPLSEFDYMIETIEGISGLPEDDFVSRAMAYFVGCFAEGELVRPEDEVKSFLHDLYRGFSKQRAA